MASIYVCDSAKRELLSLTQQQPTETGKIEIKVVFVSSNQGQRLDLPFCNNAFPYFVNTNFLALEVPQSIENTQMRVCISRRVILNPYVSFDFTVNHHEQLHRCIYASGK